MNTSHPMETTLSRRKSLIAAGAFALGASLAHTPVRARAWQEATPVVEGGVELAPGVWAEVFVGTASDRAPGQTVYLGRFTFFPGSELFSHSHPGTTIVSVDSGVLGWTLGEGTVHVIRGAATGGTTVEDVTDVDVEVMLNPGDALFYEDNVIHTARCAGEEAAIIYGTLVLTEGEPLLMPMDEAMEH